MKSTLNSEVSEIRFAFMDAMYFKHLTQVKHFGKRTTNVITAKVFKEFLKDKSKEYKVAFLFTIYEDLCNCGGISWMEYNCFKRIWEYFTDEDLDYYEFLRISTCVLACITSHIMSLPVSRLSVFS